MDIPQPGWVQACRPPEVNLSGWQLLPQRSVWCRDAEPPGVLHENRPLQPDLKAVETVAFHGTNPNCADREKTQEASCFRCSRPPEFVADRGIDFSAVGRLGGVVRRECCRRQNRGQDEEGDYARSPSFHRLRKCASATKPVFRRGLRPGGRPRSRRQVRKAGSRRPPRLPRHPWRIGTCVGLVSRGHATTAPPPSCIRC